MTPADFGLCSIFAARNFFTFAQFGFIQTRLQHAHSSCAVLVLAAVILAGDDDARGLVGNAHGRVRSVNMLPTSA